MASVRNHIRIARSPDDVWKVVSDAAAIAAWAPNVEKSSVSGNMRHAELKISDAQCLALEEEIVTSDDELRRFQYRVVEMSDTRTSAPPVPASPDILATVDVIEDGAGSLVIYSTEIGGRDDPHGELERLTAEFVKGNSAGFLRGLKEYLER
jgi:hypothetical protein